MSLFVQTTATTKVMKTSKRIRLLAGGMRASKTVSILLYLMAMAQTDKVPTLTSVVSESFPHLSKGAMRDFLNILEVQGYYDENRHNKTDNIYTFETGSKIEFFSTDQPRKVRGPSRDRLFVNEANNVPQETWEQLLFRTREFAFADWNPVGDFYLYEDYQLQDDDGAVAGDDRVDFLILTYKDNEALEAAIIEDITRKAELNPAWGRVYAEGKRGQMESKIFKNWRIIDEVPHEARLEIGGIDFGYARDKTAVCDIYYHNGGYIIDEVLSRVELKDTDLANILENRPNPNLLYIGDSADKQKIHTLQDRGINIIGVLKRGSGGETFTNAAISYVQDQRVSITKRSLNFIESYRSFMWQTDKEGNIIPKYDHYKSDEMMSVIYGMTNFHPREEEETYSDVPDITSLIY